jgi:hypothetical protein
MLGSITQSDINEAIQNAQHLMSMLPQSDDLVAPTEAQIARACSVMELRDCDSPFVNEAHQRGEPYICPIDNTEIEKTDSVMIILHCKHVFRESNLRQAFTYNYKCPLCRYDIRL